MSVRVSVHLHLCGQTVLSVMLLDKYGSDYRVSARAARGRDPTVKKKQNRTAALFLRTIFLSPGQCSLQEVCKYTCSSHGALSCVLYTRNSYLMLREDHDLSLVLEDDSEA